MPAPRQLRPYQVEARAAVEGQWDLGYQRTSVVLPTGTGKALAHETPMFTRRGWSTHGELQVGDQVLAPDGTWTTITHVHPQPVKDLIPVTVSLDTAGRDETIWASPEHLWSAVPTGFDSPMLFTTADLVTFAQAAWESRSPYETIVGGIPRWARMEVQYEATEAERFFPGDPQVAESLPIPPEVMAQVLYFGTLNNPVVHELIMDEIREPLREMGIDHSRVSRKIPAEYFLASWSERNDFLNAMSACQQYQMRTQGSKWVTSSSWLNEDLSRMHVLTSEISARRELSVPLTTDDYRALPSQCITVDREDGMYLAGATLVPTHNSTVIAGTAVDSRHRGERVVLLAHREELLHQMAESIHQVDPEGERVGIVAAAVDEPHRQIVAASFQTLARSPDRIAALGERNVILVDEAHHATSPTFLEVIRQLGINLPPEGSEHVEEVPTGSRWPVRACGFTATMSRADKRSLGALWSTVAYEKDLVWAIQEGFLIEPTGKTVVVDELNALASAKSRAGDFITSELDQVMRASLDSTVDAIMRHAQGRASIVFAVTVDHAYQLRDALLAEGLRAEVVAGKHSRAERVFVYEAYNSGGLDAIITVQVLTEGADFPRCDCIVLARPTRSRVLFTQMVGRAVRPYTDPVTGVPKSDALVIDLTGSIRDTKLVTLTDLWGSAEVERVNADGESVPLEEEPAPKLTAAEREGVLQLEHVTLYGDAAADTHLATTHQGVVYMPSGEKRRSLILWPPHPQGRNRVYLINMDHQGKWSVFRDDKGAPLYDTYDNALPFFIEMGQRMGIRRPMPKRDHRRMSSSRQLDYARALKLPVTAQTPSWEVSEMIRGYKINQALGWDTNTLKTLTV